MLRQQIQEWLEKRPLVNTTQWGDDHKRIVRMVISENRKKGLYFIPVEKDVYWNTQYVRTAFIEKFMWVQIKHLRTLYRNTVKPLKGMIKDRKLQSIMDSLDLLFAEEMEDEVNAKD